MAKNQAKKSAPLIESLTQSFPPNGSMLITGCNIQGGLFVATFQSEQLHFTKLDDTDYRGVAKHGDCYVIISNMHGVCYCNSRLECLRINRDHVETAHISDMHGISVYGDIAYVVESSENTIALYSLPDLVRINEVVLAPKGQDILHANDIYVVDEHVAYVSMFSPHLPWRESEAKGISSVVMCVDLDTGAMECVLNGLRHPHSVQMLNGALLLCNSAHFTIEESGKPIFSTTGYLRGLAEKDGIYYVGQSTCRNANSVKRLHEHISVDSGFHVFNRHEKISRFYHLPCLEVYDILLLDEVIPSEDLDKYSFSPIPVEG